MVNDNNKISCSLGILTYNSGETLEKCLESAKNFSEIIICDGGSTDNTLEIASEYNCIVVQQDMKYKYENNKISDFSGVRNQTIEAASNDWFCYIDSDEYFSDDFVAEIKSIIISDDTNSAKVFKTPRKYVVQDKIIDCSSNYPNYHTRFFHRKYIEGFRKKVHEKLVIKEGVKVGTLSSVTYVPIDVDFVAIKKKQEYYLNIEQKRLVGLDKIVILRAIISTLRGIVVRCVKIPVSYILCSGTHMPIKMDLYSLRYSFLLTTLLIRELFVSKL